MAAPVIVGPQPEETVRRAGLRALRGVLPPAEPTFPTRPNGTSLLLKQSLFERLLSGKMQTSSIPASDISAAQGDVKHLSLEQLLAVLSSQGDLPAGAAGPLVSFLAAVDAAITEQLAKRLEASVEVAQLVELIYGARSGAQLPEADLWLVRVSGRADSLLHLPSCQLQPLFDTPALAHSAVSKASAAVPRGRRKLHWEVQLCEKPGEFKERAPSRMSVTERRASGEARRSLAGRGYAKAAAQAVAAPEAASEEEETASEETDDEVQPGSRPRVEAAGFVTAAQAQAVSEEKSAEAGEALEALRRELASAKADAAAREARLQADLAAALDSKATADEEMAQLRAELSSAQSAEAGAMEECAKLKQELDSARKAEADPEELRSLQAELAAIKAAAEEEAAKLRAELASARDAEALSAEECAKLQRELASARDAEALASSEVEKLQQEVTNARDAEARAADEVARLEVEVKTARDAEAQALDEAAAVRQGTDEGSDLQWSLLAAKDAEAHLREQLAEAKAAEAKALADATEARRLLAEAKETSPSRGAEVKSSSALQEELAAAAAAAEDADRLTKTLQNQLKAREKPAEIQEDADAESFASADSDSQGFVSPLKPSPSKGM